MYFEDLENLDPTTSSSSQKIELYENQGHESMPHKMDIYVPQDINASTATLKYPVIFYIHGGAWHLGSKTKARQPCEDLANQGYVCVATDYSLTSPDVAELGMSFTIVFLLVLMLLCNSLTQMFFVMFLLLVTVILFWGVSPLTSNYCVSSGGSSTSGIISPNSKPKNEHPTHILDVARNFQWCYENIADFRGDPENIVVMGHSSGAHLAALLSTNSVYLESVGLSLEKIQGCISVSGVYSDHRLRETYFGQKILKSAFGQRSSYYDAFPIYHITEKTPPFLLLNAGMDISLKRHTLDFHYALRQRGVFVETDYYEDRNHWDIMHDWSSTNNAIMQKVTTFLDELYRYRNKI
jgi:acetyl esterase/lipase